MSLTKVLAISVIIEYFPLTFARQLFCNVNTSEILNPVLKAIQTTGIKSYANHLYAQKAVPIQNLGYNQFGYYFSFRV